MNTLNMICCLVIALGTLKYLFLNHVVPPAPWTRTALYIMGIGASGIVVNHWTGSDWRYIAQVKWWTIMHFGMAMWMMSTGARQIRAWWITGRWHDVREPLR